MSIQVLVLETGETVIGDISEVLDKEKNESLGYRVSDPYIVKTVYETIDPNAPEGEVQAQRARIDFDFWAPLAQDREFDFVKDFVRVIYTPQESVTQMYFDTLAKKESVDGNEVNVDTMKTIVTVKEEDTGLQGKEVNTEAELAAAQMELEARQSGSQGGSITDE